MKEMLRIPMHFATLLLLSLVFLSGCRNKNDVADIRITLADTIINESVDGRLLIMIADNNTREPRFQISDGAATQLIFGMDAEGWEPGGTLRFNSDAIGYPLRSIKEIPEGEYYIQAFLNRYETFNLSTGHTIKMHMDQGEGQQWLSSPGNLYSEPVRISVKGGKIRATLELVNMIPPIAPAEDSEYIKHIRIESKSLTEFWGRPMHLQANVLVPAGFDPASDARYPLFVFHGHFPYSIGDFRTTPPDAAPDDTIYNSRFGITGYDYIQQKEAWDFYQKWISDDFPRYVIIEIQHPNPYYDDSYAVNSANIGPYGDAIMKELIPEVEKLFNCVGEGWGRFTYGGSTGGWEALAVQVLYPDDFNGCFAACPDPIDFRAYTVVNIYEDKNAYYLDSRYKKTSRPGMRDGRGHVKSTLEEQNILEYVLGTNSRSGGQWDIWQAVFSPQGEDGYPKPIWDKLTGEIDTEVANHWRENYDLRYILERDWATLGSRLEGKIHIYCGDMDNYYLNNAVVLMEKFLESTTDPYYDGVVEYGDGFEHCWNGDHNNPNYITRLRYNWQYNDLIRERLRKSAPADHKLVNWGIR